MMKKNALIYSTMEQKYQNIDKETLFDCNGKNVHTSDRTATHKKEGGKVKRSYE
jgi:RNA:NAD 2'-phosphotransferase (TPT1/KptA family)